MADSVAGGSDRRTALSVLALLGCTVVPIAVAAAYAPIAGPDLDVLWTLPLFVGSSMHVASTAWFYSVPEVRAHMRERPRRYWLAPAAFVTGSAVLLSVLSTATTRWVLLGFFAWQFVHFQKQNLGVTVLVGRARGVLPPTRAERLVLTGAGVGGVLGLLGHPALLQEGVQWSSDFLFFGGLAVFVVSVVCGFVAYSRRRLRDVDHLVTYGVSLLFFVPVFVFESPYAAVAGLTIAHGLQYLVLMTMVASGSRDRVVSLLVLLNIALFAGLGLGALSHQHGRGVIGQALFGAFLGLSMAHFVIDGGLWRLREEFPRRFLHSRVPYLLAPDSV